MMGGVFRVMQWDVFVRLPQQDATEIRKGWMQEQVSEIDHLLLPMQMFEGATSPTTPAMASIFCATCKAPPAMVSDTEVEDENFNDIVNDNRGCDGHGLWLANGR